MDQDELKATFDRQAPTDDQQRARLDASSQSIHLCTAGLNVGDRVALALRLADASIPAEPESLLAGDEGLAAAWQALSEHRRGDASEHIRAAKGQATRQRRAALTTEALRGKTTT